MTTIAFAPSKPLPLGATIYNDHTQFAIFSRHARQIWLLLFDRATDIEPAHTIALDPDSHRQGDVWHIALRGIEAGQCYLYRVDGPEAVQLGYRFDHHRWLLDPYAKALTKPIDSLQVEAQGNQALPKCVVADSNFDWQGDKPLNRPYNETIIYEAHARGLTKHPSSGVSTSGTFQGIIEHLDTWQALGITALELLPIQAFDHASRFRNPETGQNLSNYWGYNTLSFFAPDPAYSQADAAQNPLAVPTECKTMVRELHKAGIEIILDVVYNHSGEGDHAGSTLSFKGIDNTIYYHLEDDPQRYKNYAGTGNTLNCNHPVVQDLILDSLRYWVTEFHIDGFRFDLASILCRDQEGHLLDNPPLVERIAEDPVLQHTKIIAEAWDAAGAYQVGAFPHRRWAEWNGRYRDDIRRFWLGEPGLTGALATRFSGSSDLYGNDGRTPNQSINFITSHDGFTLNDLVSYQQKHNLANGENNQDGHNHSYNDNLGEEGPSTNWQIERRRMKRIKNFLATLLLSQGVP
ncbi:MAG: isoamylase, partial [Chloroflexota bacterium]